MQAGNDALFLYRITGTYAHRASAEMRIVMKKKFAGYLVLLGIAGALFGAAVEVKASGRMDAGQYYIPEDAVICDGVYAGNIDLSGMTEAEAENAVMAYIESCGEVPITLQEGENDTVTVSAEQLGLTWDNPELIEEAVGIGKKGNIVKRYMEMTDLSYENRVFDIEISFDREKVEELVAAQSEIIDVEAVNPTLTHENGAFTVVPGVDGVALDVEKSVDLIEEYLTQEWDHSEASIALAVEITKPEYAEEDLAQVGDVLGSWTTSFATSDSSRSANVRNACQKVNGTVLYPGEEFSTLATIAPFTTANGYYAAGSYAGGKVVDSVGGGICQVSSTLYNAVLYSELEVTDRSNHAMMVSYVSVGMDATVSEDSGIDFKFKNNTEYPIYIEGYTTSSKKITMTIYGVETRDAGHEVSYYSDITSTTPPGPEIIYADASQPVGFIEVQPAHTGYTADVYRIIKENGVEISREQITHSVYKMTSRSATVGIATSDPTTYNVMQMAIASGSVDYVKAVVGQLATGTYAGPFPDGTAPATDPAAGGTDAATPGSTETTAPAAEVPAPAEAQPPAAENVTPGV